MILKDVLKQSQMSITKPRIAVFEALEKHGALSISELATRLSDIDRASVYRTVELFEKLGIVHRIWLGFKSKVELSEMFTPHHHHFLCRHCGAVIEIEDQPLEQALQVIAGSSGLLLEEHSIELRGLCSNCR